ncbi:hypothetical protein PACTADRAFT_49987 [Pachysolen tannophilus NRRL Y-2460]|uniref:Uncharacterized protein n=1 Tax=Pachysolen tannophilus NRRL Y-2460 TaxID=669874 RepID=A0A1E4TU23_PACTA|nr:hypothetical protein PACTADRAFT_49987 [Pachysolen tannophilus NRRL Y-2460]
MELSLYAVNLRNVFKNPVLNEAGYRVKLVDNDESLLIAERVVIWLKGDNVFRKLIFEDDEIVVDAIFTTFNSVGNAHVIGNSGASSVSSTSTTVKATAKCLVVLLREHAHVYYLDGTKYIISFPFHLNSALSFENGLILEREFSNHGNRALLASHGTVIGTGTGTTTATTNGTGTGNGTGTSTSTSTSTNSGIKSSSTSGTAVGNIGSNSNNSSGSGGPLNNYELSIPGSSSTMGNSSSANGNGSNTTSTNGNNNQINFLTMLDPLSEFGAVVSSSTSSISNKENLILFPASNKSSLAATFNSSDHVITVYHVRFLTHNKIGNEKKTSTKKTSSISSSTAPGGLNNQRSMSRRKSSLRKISSNNHSASSNTPKKMEIEENNDNNNNKNNDNTNNLKIVGSVNSASLGYDKIRSTSHSEVLSLDRMASGTESIPDSIKPVSSKFDTINLRKDVILTKIESIEFQDDKHLLKICNSSYANQDCIVINNLKTKQCEILLFKKSENNSISLPVFQTSFTISCLDCIPLAATNSDHDGILIILKDSSNICLINPFLNLISANIDLSTKSYPPIKLLSDSNGLEIAMIDHDKKFHILNLIIKPKLQVVSKILESLKYLSNSYAYEYFWLQWCSALSLDESLNEWNALITVLLSVLIPDKTQFDESKIPSNEITSRLPSARFLRNKTEAKYSLTDLAPKLILSIHLLREDMKLDLNQQIYVEKLGVLLSQLTLWMGWSENWYNYYNSNKKFDHHTRFLSIELINKPLNLFESLSSLFNSSLSSANDIVPYLTFSQLAEENESIDELLIPRTYYILRLFEAIVSNDFEAKDVVDLMVEFGITINDLKTYPVGVSIPLIECIVICQENTPIKWSEAALELVGRKDLLRFLHSSKLQNKFKRVKTDESVDDINKISAPTGARDINQILQSLNDVEPISSWDGQAEADRINITKLIFSEDRRFYEVTKLLQTSKVQTAALSVDIDLSEHELLTQQRELAANVALRTLTIPLGRSALFLSSRLPLMTERFPIPKLNFNCLISPSMTTTTLDADLIDVETTQWGFFHNGASSGLTISRDAKGISGSWIVFNQPPVLNAQHAGFLLGLGLNGHLKRLEEWHIYNYLGPKHTYTSIGLLLGMSASLRGTMDVKLTKVLSVHVIALLPPGATDLKVSLPVQTAGLIGVGLLYLETQHHRMSEILLSQIDGKLVYDDVEIVNEGYRLAAGISLGYINLGKGDDIKGLNDTHIVDKLLSMAVSLKDVQTSQQFDKSCGGAILALSFIYMKTGNESIAWKLVVPETEQLLDYVRPDLLLLRCVGKNLIMWQNIGNSIMWVDSQVPLCLLRKYALKDLKNLGSDQLSFFNIIGGSCLSIALRYASTGDVQARDTVLYYLDAMMKICLLPATNHDEKLTHAGACTIRDVLSISASLIMAGTGDLEVFRRLRVLYGNTQKSVSYGNYMAINMALGFLFLGGGQYAFSDSNFSIATLITAIYPIFPSSNTSMMSEGNVDVHLQALRHFWALSVEPRCLIIRDVDSLKPCEVPVQVELTDGSVLPLKSPCLLPNLSHISRIQTLSNDYFKLVIDLKRNYEHYKFFKKYLTLYIYQKESYHAKKSFSDIIRSLGEKEETKIKSRNKNGVYFKNPLKDRAIFNIFDDFEKSVIISSLSSSSKEDDENSLSNYMKKTENKLLEMSSSPTSIDDLWNLKILFKFCDQIIDDDLHYLSIDFIEQLKVQIWYLVNNL